MVVGGLVGGAVIVSVVATVLGVLNRCSLAALALAPGGLLTLGAFLMPAGAGRNPKRCHEYDC